MNKNTKTLLIAGSILVFFIIILIVSGSPKTGNVVSESISEEVAKESEQIIYEGPEEEVKENIPNLNESREKGIYYALTEAQDRIPFDDEQYSEKIKASEEVVAEEYGISMEELNDIIYRGSIELWPVPEYPY